MTCSKLADTSQYAERGAADLPQRDDTPSSSALVWASKEARRAGPPGSKGRQLNDPPEHTQRSALPRSATQSHKGRTRAGAGAFEKHLPARAAAHHAASTHGDKH